MQTKINKQTKNSWQLQNTFIHRSKTPKKNNTHKHILQQIHHHNNLHIYPLHLQPPPKKNGPYMVYAKKLIFQLPIEIPNPRHQAVVSPAILPRSSPRWWNAGRPASKTWPRPGGHGPGTKDSPMVAWSWRLQNSGELLNKNHPKSIFIQVHRWPWNFWMSCYSPSIQFWVSKGHS